MADLQKTVEIIFGGRNELSQVIGNVERSLDSLNSASQPFADMADNVLRAELAVLALGTAFAGLSIEQAGTFGDQFSEITTLISDNSADLGSYRQSILDYATTSTQSIDSITGAVYSAISAGVEYTDALGVMNTAEQLAVAGKADLNSTLVALAGTLNAYGAEVSAASDYSDTFFTIVKQGQTTIPELATSLSQVTNTAAAAGIPFAELGAAIAALTASGMPTSQAITAIKAALSNIIKPSSEAQKVAADLGIEFNATALRTQGLGGFMQALQDATGGNIETMGRLFGSTEALNGMMVLAGDSSGLFADSLEAMENRSGATAIAFEKMVDAFGLNNQRLVNNLQTVLIGIGTPLLDEYGGVINALVANLQGIGSAINSGDLDGLISIFESALNDIDQLLSGVAAALPDALAGINWDSFTGSLDNLQGSLSGAFAAIFGEIDLSTVEGVEDVIQRVVDLLAGLTNTSAGVVDGMRPLFLALGELADHFATADADGQEFAGKILGIGKSVHEITSVLSSATSAVSGLSNGLLLLGGSSIINSLRGLAAINTTAITGLFASLAPILGTAAGVGAAGAGGFMLGTWINDQINAITQAFSGEETLGGLIYEWIHGDEGNLEAEIIATVNKVREIPTVTEEVAAEVAAIPWHIDEDGTLVGDINSMTDTVKLKLAEISSQETIVTIKAETEIDIAEIEAQTKRVIAVLELEGLQTEEVTKRIQSMYEFNSTAVIAEADKITSAFDASADSIGSLSGELSAFAGLLDNTDLDYFDRTDIENFVSRQLDQQEKLIDSQVRLADAQAALIELKYDKLTSGEALIRIESDGLEPALEQVLWSIMEKVQLKVAMEEAELLLALDAGV
ncbi:MAG: phage tail tape measure protein [Desulfuromusa sp.]